MRSRTGLITTVGVALSLAVAATAAFLWRGEGPVGPERAAEMRDLDSPLLALQTLLATGLIALCAGVVGAAATLLLPRAQRARLGPLVVVALGLTALGATGMLEWRAVGAVTFAPWITVGAAVLGLATAAVMRIRRAGFAGWGLHLRVAAHRAWRGLDVVIIAATVAVCLPVARFGLTAWTAGIHDWHRYAASAVIAMDGEEAFASRFAGNFGQSLISRANFEKTGVTSVLASVSTLTGLEPFQLLTPMIVLSMAVLIAATATLIRRMWHLAPLTGVLIAVPIGLALPVVGRVFDAQLGGLTASAFLAASMALAVTFRSRSNRLVAVSAGIVTALVGVFAMASNSTVVLSSLPVAAIIVAWAWTRKAPPRGQAAWYAIGIGVTVVGALAYFAPLFMTSFANQDDVAPSFPHLPLASSAAALGLEPPGLGFPSGIAEITWAVTFVVVLVLGWSTLSRLRDRVWFTALVAVCALGGAAFIIHFGADTYLTGKWIAAVIPIASPVVVAAIVAGISSRERMRTPALAIGAGVGVTAMLFASYVAYGVSQVVPVTWLAIRDAEFLAEAPVVNVLTDGSHAAGFLPLLVPSSRVVVSSATYAKAEPPQGDVFLVDQRTLTTRDWTDPAAVAPSLFLAHLDMSTNGDRDFATDPAAGDVLFGPWNSREPGSTSLSESASQNPGLMVVRVPPPNQAQTLRIEIDGLTAGTTENAPPIQITATIAGHEETTSAPFGQPLHLELNLAAHEIPADGTLVISFVATGDPHQSAFQLNRAKFTWIDP